MRLTIILRTISLVIAAYVAAGESFAAAASKATTPVQVGVLLPLTGEFASWGEGIRRAIELAAETEHSRFSFQFEDEGNCEARRSVSGFQKLRSGGVSFFIVGCLAGTKAILPIAKRQQVLLLSVGLLDDHVFSETSQLVNLATQLSTESRYLAMRVASRGFKRPAIIHWQDPFSNEFAETLATELRNRGVKVATQEAVDPKDADYRTVLLRVKKANPDTLCFNVGQDQQGILLRQAHDLGIRVPIFSNYVFETATALTLGQHSNNVEYSFPLNSADGSTKKANFDQLFESRYGVGSHPTPNSYFVRDGLTLLEKAFLKCAVTDPVCVGDYFKSTAHFSGLSGEVSFRTNGSNDRPYGIKRIEKGRFVWVEKRVG
jgi:branched-chain amino acid transport system substrate-binding protein